MKITSSGGRKYIKLVEAVGDDAGVSRQRVIATLGRIEAVRAGETNALINGLLRAADQPTIEDDMDDVILSSNGGPPVKRLNYATEVTGDKSKQTGQGEAYAPLAAVQIRGAGAGRADWGERGGQAAGVARCACCRTEGRLSNNWPPRTLVSSASWPSSPRSWRS